MIAFVNVNVVPMDTDRVLIKQTVMVEGDRIAAIGPVDEVKVPDGVEIIAGNGAYLVPGLADMHMHIESIKNTFEGPGQLCRYLAEGVTTVRNLSALPEHLAWSKEIILGEIVGPTLYNGRLVAGLPSELHSMKLIFQGIVIFSPVVLGFFVWLVLWLALNLTGNQSGFQQIQRYILPSLGALLLVGGIAAWRKIIPLNVYTSKLLPNAVVSDSDVEARRIVKKIKAAGFDFVKAYDYLSVDAYLALLDEARKQDIYVIGHALDKLASKLETMFSSGLREVVHVDELMDAHMIGEASPNKGFKEVSFNYETIPLTAETVKSHDVLVVSNLVADEVIYQMLEDPQSGLSQPEYLVVAPRVINRWKTEGRFVNWQGQQVWRRNVQMPFLMTLIKALHLAGVPLLIGTDMNVEGMLPAHVHRELELLVEAGLSPYEALRAGTRNAGLSVERMGGAGNFGRVEVGQRADLILLKENPLQNISHTRNRIGVMARGRWFTQAELHRMLEIEPV